MARLWWLPVGVGLASIGAGVAVLARPDHSLRALAVIVGIFVLVDGAAELVRAFARESAYPVHVAVLGALNLIAGVLLVRHPIAGVPAVALVIGVWLLAAGLIRLVLALQETRGERLAGLTVAAIEGVFGIIIVASPRIGYDTLAVLVGASFIGNGLAMMFFGYATRRGGGAPPAIA